MDSHGWAHVGKNAACTDKHGFNGIHFISFAFCLATRLPRGTMTASPEKTCENLIYETLIRITLKIEKQKLKLLATRDESVNSPRV